MIPRVDYITLFGAPDGNAQGTGGATINTSGLGYTWQIPNAYYKNFRAGDRLQVELIGCQFDALPVGATMLQNRPARVMCNIPCGNVNDINGEVMLGISTMLYISANTGLVCPKNTPQSSVLITNKFDQISINVYTSAQLNITQESGGATGVCFFLLKISYFENEN